MENQYRSVVPTSQQLAEAIPDHLKWLKDARRESDRRSLIVFLVGVFGFGVPTAACLAPHVLRAMGG